MTTIPGDMERRRIGGEELIQPVRELRDTFLLIALTVSSLAGYLGLGFLAVRIFAR